MVRCVLDKEKINSTTTFYKYFDLSNVFFMEVKWVRTGHMHGNDFCQSTVHCLKRKNLESFPCVYNSCIHIKHLF